MKEIGFETEQALWSWSESIDEWLDKYDSYEEFMENYGPACASILFKQFAWFAALRKWKPEHYHFSRPFPITKTLFHPD